MNLHYTSKTPLLVMTAALLFAGCSQQAPAQTGGRRPATPAAHVAITPANGTDDARPDHPVTVRVIGGTLRQVTVSGRDGQVTGALNAARTQWTSRGPLAPDAQYRVVAAAVGPNGRTTTTTSGFSTLQPKAIVAAGAVAPAEHETVGVGMPIILTFDHPVYNMEDVERALEVKASKPVKGAWRWVGRQQVVYRTKEHWPPYTDVTLNARLKGVRAAKDVYGTRDLKLKFRIGDEQISTANAITHQMTVKENGQIVRRIPVSMGKATKRAYTTTNGVHLTMDKAYHVVMDSATVGIPKGHPDYYKQDVHYAVRISNSGEFTHSAPWSVPSQGRVNVSHGCVNMSPENAAWFYRFSRRGDIYKITGTGRELEWDNGWGYWQLSWPEWKAGSALSETAG